MSKKPNHHSLIYKQQANPNKQYKELKQKQKQKIAEWMFEQVYTYYQKHHSIPSNDVCHLLVDLVYQKICNYSIWVPYDEVIKRFLSGLPKWEIRIKEKDIPALSKPETKSKQKETHQRKKKKATVISDIPDINQDDTFYFIAGYTSSGVPYGITWEEIALKQFEDIE